MYFTKYIATGLLIFAIGCSLLYGGYNRTPFRVANERSGQHTNEQAPHGANHTK